METKTLFAVLAALTMFIGCGMDGKDGVDGHNGIDGSDGVDGADGIDGTNGTDNRVTSSFDCGGKVAAYGVSVNYNYTKVVFASGDVFVDAALMSGAYESSSSDIHRANTGGAINGSVFVQMDIYGAETMGFWEITKSGNAVKLEYLDAEATGNGTTLYGSTADCTAYNY